MRARAGDKVRVKQNGVTGARAIIVRASGNSLVIQLQDSGKKLSLNAEEVVNFSLAARKAWVTMPQRAVGRKKGTRFSDRVSVTLRIDRDLWERFQSQEAKGLIEDRTA